jgi:hypothetical protein
MTRAGGVSNAHARAPETRGAKNRTGEPTSWRGCRGRNNAEAGWPGAGKLRAVRRDRRTPKGRRQPQERRSPACPRQTARAVAGEPVTREATGARSSPVGALKRAPPAEADVDDAQGREVSVRSVHRRDANGQTNTPGHRAIIASARCAANSHERSRKPSQRPPQTSEEDRRSDGESLHCLRIRATGNGRSFFQPRRVAVAFDIDPPHPRIAVRRSEMAALPFITGLGIRRGNGCA